jgi:alkane 1-monooxygenase
MVVSFVSPAFVHLLMPLLDMAIGEDLSNPPKSADAQLEQDIFYRALVWAYVPFPIAATVYGAWLSMTMSLPWLGLHRGSDRSGTG